jgi:hypothetical protein
MNMDTGTKATQFLFWDTSSAVHLMVVAVCAHIGHTKLQEILIYAPSVADPDPNPHVFGPPGSGSGSFYHHAKIVRKILIPTIF